MQQRMSGPVRWICLFWLVLSLAGAAEQVTVDGRPLTGVVEGSGSATMAELASLLVALDLPHHPAYGGWCVTRKLDGEDCPAKELAGPDQVIVEGRPVPTRRLEGKLLVNVARFAELLKLSVTHPRADVIDLALDAVPPAPVAGYKPIVRAGTPGESVDLARLLVPGRANVVLFYTDWCPACWKFWPFLESLNRTRPDLAVVAVDIADFKSAVARQYQVRMTPMLAVYDGTGQRLAEGVEADRWLARTYDVRMPTALKCVGSPDK